MRTLLLILLVGALSSDQVGHLKYLDDYLVKVNANFKFGDVKYIKSVPGKDKINPPWICHYYQARYLQYDACSTTYNGFFTDDTNPIQIILRAEIDSSKYGYPMFLWIDFYGMKFNSSYELIAYIRDSTYCEGPDYGNYNE